MKIVSPNNASITLSMEEILQYSATNAMNSMYINQHGAQNSCDQTLFSIRRSTCFGLH